jgi:HAD superfamily hydrolase (TIGR01490 family)
MNTKQTIVAFDFDGTITTRDTFPAFIRFARGAYRLAVGIVLHSPLLIAYKLKLYPNWKIKQQLFAYFFKGATLADFDRTCADFCCQSQHLIRPLAAQAIRRHIENDATLVVLSAGIDNWVRPFAERLGITVVLCTQIETDATGRLTGRFSTPNTYGKEKVNRLLACYPNRSDYRLIAYGDSQGDRALLDFADERGYRTFHEPRTKN